MEVFLGQSSHCTQSFFFGEESTPTLMSQENELVIYTNNNHSFSANLVL